MVQTVVSKRLEEHSKKIDRIDQQQAEHYRILSSIDRRLTPELLAKIEQHDHTLYGNGSPGMDEQIRNIGAWIDSQKQSADRRRAWWDKFQWIVIPMGVAGVVAFVGQFLVFWFDVVPKLQQLP